MRRYLLLVPLVLLGVILTSCGEPQSFQSPSPIGSDWRAIGPEGINVTSLAISPAFSTDGTLFLGLHGWELGVFRSTDSGETWEQVYEGLRGGSAPWVAVSPSFASDKTLFAVRGNGGVHRSTDGGDSWKRITRGLPSYQDTGECCGYYGVSDLAFSPSFVDDNTLYQATWDGLFRSTDRGDTWRNVFEGLEDAWIIRVVISPSYASDNTLFALARNPTGGAGPSLYRSTDRGDTWRQVTANLWVDWDRWVTTRLVISPSFGADGTLYAATHDGLLRSNDRGETWRKVYSYDGVLEGNFEPWVVVSPNFASDNTVYTSKVCGGVFRSTDGGDSWHEVSQGLTVPEVAATPYHHTCSPAGITALLFSPSFAENSGLFLWTEAGIFLRNRP